MKSYKKNEIVLWTYGFNKHCLFSNLLLETYIFIRVLQLEGQHDYILLLLRPSSQEPR
jgi:hypothetical protein